MFQIEFFQTKFSLLNNRLLISSFTYSTQIINAIIYNHDLNKMAKELCLIHDGFVLPILNEFYDCFQNLRTFINRIKEDAKSNGYVETIAGRRRLLPLIGKNEDRKAVSVVVRNSVADLHKLTMLKIDAVIKQENIDVKMLLQVQNEFIFEVRNDDQTVDLFVDCLVKQMVGCCSLMRTNVSIKIKKGSNMNEMSEIDIMKNMMHAV